MNWRCLLGRHSWTWLGREMSGLKRCSRCGKWGVIPWLAELRRRQRG